MVFNECNGILGNCEVYRLTFDGYRQISKCFKNPKTLHLACESHTFYETAPYIFEDLPMNVGNFNTDNPIEEMDVEVQSEKLESDKQSDMMNYDLDDKDIGGKLPTYVLCQVCNKKFSNLLLHLKETSSCNEEYPLAAKQKIIKIYDAKKTGKAKQSRKVSEPTTDKSSNDIYHETEIHKKTNIITK